MYSDYVGKGPTDWQQQYQQTAGDQTRSDTYPTGNNDNFDSKQYQTYPSAPGIRHDGNYMKGNDPFENNANPHGNNDNLGWPGKGPFHGFGFQKGSSLFVYLFFYFNKHFMLV